MIRILTLTGCILVCLATFHKASAQTRQSVTPGISAASVHGIQTTVPGTTAAGTGFPYTGLQEPYPGFRPGFDNDIKQMRNNIAPGLRYHLDNYTQYLPAAVMVGLKTFGYFNWILPYILTHSPFSNLGAPRTHCPLAKRPRTQTLTLEKGLRL